MSKQVEITNLSGSDVYLDSYVEGKQVVIPSGAGGTFRTEASDLNATWQGNTNVSINLTESVGYDLSFRVDGYEISEHYTAMEVYWMGFVFGLVVFTVAWLFKIVKILGYHNQDL